MKFIEQLIYAAMLFEGMLMIMPSGNMRKYVRLIAGITLSVMLITSFYSYLSELSKIIG